MSPIPSTASSSQAATWGGATSCRAPAKKAKIVLRSGPVTRGELTPSRTGDSMRPQILNILMTSGRYKPRGALPTAAEQATLEHKAASLCAAAELPTLQRAVATWGELRSWMAGVGASFNEVSPHAIADWLAKHASPSPAFTSLRWLNKHVLLELDLSLCQQPVRKKKGLYGMGGRQALVAPPGILLVFEDALRSTDPSDPDWAIAFGVFAMVLGFLRFGHLARSTLVRVDAYSLLFWCSKGKQRQMRSGFWWSLPRFTLTGFDLAVELDFSMVRKGCLAWLP